MFTRVQGKTKFMWYPMKVSTACAAGDLMCMDGTNNQLIEATATTAGSIIKGVLRHTIAATDDDYATARSVEVEVPVEKYVIWKCNEVGTGTAAAADVDTLADIDNGGAIDVDTSSYDIFQITKVVSQTDVRGILNIGMESLGVAGD